MEFTYLIIASIDQAASKPKKDIALQSISAIVQIGCAAAKAKYSIIDKKVEGYLTNWYVIPIKLAYITLAYPT